MCGFHLKSKSKQIKAKQSKAKQSKLIIISVVVLWYKNDTAGLTLTITVDESAVNAHCPVLQVGFDLESIIMLSK